MGETHESTKPCVFFLYHPAEGWKKFRLLVLCNVIPPCVSFLAIPHKQKKRFTSAFIFFICFGRHVPPLVFCLCHPAEGGQSFQKPFKSQIYPGTSRLTREWLAGKSRLDREWIAGESLTNRRTGSPNKTAGESTVSRRSLAVGSRVGRSWVACLGRRSESRVGRTRVGRSWLACLGRGSESLIGRGWVAGGSRAGGAISPHEQILHVSLPQARNPTGQTNKQTNKQARKQTRQGQGIRDEAPQPTHPGKNTS